MPPSERDSPRREGEPSGHRIKLIFQLTSADIAGLASVTGGTLVYDTGKAGTVSYFRESTPLGETPVGINYGERGRISFLPDETETILGIGGSHLYIHEGKETLDENIREYAVVFRSEEIVLVGRPQKESAFGKIQTRVITIRQTGRIGPEVMDIDRLKDQRDLLQAATLTEYFFTKSPLL